MSTFCDTAEVYVFHIDLFNLVDGFKKMIPEHGMMIPVDHRGSPWSLVFGLRSSLGRLTLDAFGKVDSITYLGSTGIWLGN